MHLRGWAMAAVEYDARVIRKFAEKLYERARSIMFLCGILGALVGLGFGAGAGGAADHAGIGALFGLIVGALIGALIGERIGFSLKLQAQLALCQVRIEENTRGHAVQDVPAPSSANTNTSAA